MSLFCLDTSLEVTNHAISDPSTAALLEITDHLPLVPADLLILGASFHTFGCLSGR